MKITAFGHFRAKKERALDHRDPWRKFGRHENHCFWALDHGALPPHSLKIDSRNLPRRRKELTWEGVARNHQCSFQIFSFFSSIQTLPSFALAHDLQKIFFGGQNKPAVFFPQRGRIGSFFSIFRDLQDLHTFAPLQTQNFSEILLDFLAIWSIFRF